MVKAFWIWNPRYEFPGSTGACINIFIRLYLNFKSLKLVCSLKQHWHNSLLQSLSNKRHQVWFSFIPFSGVTEITVCVTGWQTISVCHSVTTLKHVKNICHFSGSELLDFFFSGDSSFRCVFRVLSRIYKDREKKTNVPPNSSFPWNRMTLLGQPPRLLAAGGRVCQFSPP